MGWLWMVGFVQNWMVGFRRRHEICPNEEQRYPKHDPAIVWAEEQIDEKEGNRDEYRPLLEVFEDEIEQG